MPWVHVAEIAKQNTATKKEIEQVLDYRRRKAKPKFYADETKSSGRTQYLHEMPHVFRDRVCAQVRGGGIYLNRLSF